MKRSLSWLLVALWLVSCGGGDDGSGPGDGGNNNPPKPQPTAVGAPDGTPTSQTIGAGGGTVMSEDRLFTVTIPPGALNSDTLITVQPVVNTGWGGIGKGYRLTPDGLHFNAPVSLAFKVASKDLARTAADLVDVAVQDDQGFWYTLKNRTFDAGTSTITATTTHFSYYICVMGGWIFPESAVLTPKSEVSLIVSYCYKTVYQGPDGSLKDLLYSCGSDDPSVVISNWSVNGVKGGTTATGTVQQTNENVGHYTAPASSPAVNPVTVSVEMTAGTRNKALLTSKILIVGDYTGDVTHVTGSGMLGEKAVWHMQWVSHGTLYGIETFAGLGTLDYTPQILPCTIHTFAPTTAEVAFASMIIDRRSEPYTVTVALQAGWDVRECDNCNGNVICSDRAFLQGFADGGTGTISADGDSIYGKYYDGGSGEDWNYTFTH